MDALDVGVLIVVIVVVFVVSAVVLVVLDIELLQKRAMKMISIELALKCVTATWLPLP